MPVIGHLGHSPVNHMPLNGVFLTVFVLFANQIENNFNFSHKKVFKDFLSSNFVLTFLPFVIGNTYD